MCLALSDQPITAEIQRRFPSLTIVSDQDRSFAGPLGLVSMTGLEGPALAPTTILIDRDGVIRWFYRPPSIADRLKPPGLLDAADRYLSPR